MKTAVIFVDHADEDTNYYVIEEDLKRFDNVYHGISHNEREEELFRFFFENPGNTPTTRTDFVSAIIEGAQVIECGII